MTAIISTLGSSILSSIATKTFDSLVTSKYSNRNDKNKWLREKTLNLFSELSNEINSINCENLKEKQVKIKQLILRVNLLIDSEKLQKNLNNYSFILDEYECYKNDIDLQSINEELFSTLKAYIKRI